MIGLTAGGVAHRGREDAGEWRTAGANVGRGLGRGPVETVWLAAEADAGGGRRALRREEVGDSSDSMLHRYINHLVIVKGSGL